MPDIHGPKSHLIVACPDQAHLRVAQHQSPHLLSCFLTIPFAKNFLHQHHIRGLRHGLAHTCIARDGAGGGTIFGNGQQMLLGLKQGKCLVCSSHVYQSLGCEITRVLCLRLQASQPVLEFFSGLPKLASGQIRQATKSHEMVNFCSVQCAQHLRSHSSFIAKNDTAWTSRYRPRSHFLGHSRECAVRIALRAACPGYWLQPAWHPRLYANRSHWHTLD